MSWYAKKQLRAGLLVFWGALLTLPSLAADSSAPAQSSQPPKGQLDTITVEAAKNRKVLEHQVSAFVSGIAVAPYEESLANWQASVPLCPLVAGMPHDDGEYMLARVSIIAKAAGAPLADEHCKPNLFVVVTSHVDALFKAWGRRDPNMFGEMNGRGGGPGGTVVHKFLHSSTPVRAFYNASLYNSDGTPLGGGDALGNGIANEAGWNLRADATRIQFNDVRNLASVIVIIDGPRAKGVTFGQLAAYVAMIGLAEIRLDARPGEAPSSILQLFASSGKAAPAGLSAWDEAFLRALYHIDHLDQHQLARLKTEMVGEIAPH
jgi:hypothetical protein